MGSVYKDHYAIMLAHVLEPHVGGLRNTYSYWWLLLLHQQWLCERTVSVPRVWRHQEVYMMHFDWMEAMDSFKSPLEPSGEHDEYVCLQKVEIWLII